MARLQIHRQRDSWGVGRGQAGWEHGGADASRHLADADIEGKVRMFPLRYAYGVVQGRRQMSSGDGQDCAQVYRRVRFLGESHRGHGHDSVRDGQWNP